MELTLQNYLNQLIHNPTLIIISMLTLGVILVNGWTDAPNAIATCVSTRSIRPKKAIVMAAIFNFLGVFIMTFISSTVAETIYNIVNFGDNAYEALVALCAGLFAIVTWAIFAWYFGIPTSESHALIAGISGAAIAVQKGISGINFYEWKKVIYGLIISTVLGFCLGFLINKMIEKICRHMDRRKTIPFFKKTQVSGGALVAFMHGAQDGQKFMGIFLMALALSNGITETQIFEIPIWLMILCSATMTIGTSIGGYKIIKTVGMDMVKLEPYQGTAADLAGACCMLLSSLFGIPVSTTHTKTTAIMGVGASRGLNRVDWNIVKNMVLAWIFTFPGCGLLGYVVTLIFMKIF